MKISISELVETLKWRYAVKKFDATKKIPNETWNALEDSLVLTPSSYGLEPWKFIVVTSDEMKQKLKPATWNQSQVTDCSHYVVFTYKAEIDEAYVDRHINRMMEIRHTKPEQHLKYRQMLLANTKDASDERHMKESWLARQAYIALGNFMTSAAFLGIDTCPIEGLEPEKYDEILGLKESGYKTLCTCAAGYRAADDKYASIPKVRFEKSDVIQKI